MTYTIIVTKSIQKDLDNPPNDIKSRVYSKVSQLSEDLLVLDSCVLYPMYLRDTLLRAAEAGLYRVHWSQEILDGALRNLVANQKMQIQT